MTCKCKTVATGDVAVIEVKSKVALIAERPASVNLRHALDSVHSFVIVQTNVMTG